MQCVILQKIAMIEPSQERRESSVATLTSQVEEMGDTTARLHGREAILRTINDEEHADLLLFSILRSVHAIWFAREWNAMTAKPGGKKWKGEFRKNAFQVIWAGKTSDYEKEYKRFRTRHEKVIAGRNSLLKMYRKVRLLLQVSGITLIRSSLALLFFWIPYGPQ